jgi:hypothetical protein
MMSRGTRVFMEPGRERPLAAGFSATNHPPVDEVPDGMGWSIVQPAPKPAGGANHDPRFGTGINRRRSLRLPRLVQCPDSAGSAAHAASAMNRLGLGAWPWLNVCYTSNSPSRGRPLARRAPGHSEWRAIPGHTRHGEVPIEVPRTDAGTLALTVPGRLGGVPRAGPVQN